MCGATPLLTIERATEIECLFERIKPAHTEIVFDYTNQIDLVAQAAQSLKGGDGLTLDENGAVLEWASGGLAPVTFSGTSEHITAADGVVTASAVGSANLTHVLAEPVDLPLGFSVFVVARMTDAPVLGTINRLFMLFQGSAAVFNALLPVSPGVVQMTTNGGNITAAGLSDSDLETYAVWGFIVDAVSGTGRILRNGGTLASGPLTADLSGLTRYRVLQNSSLAVRAALTFDRASAEIDAAVTAHLKSEHNVF